MQEYLEVIELQEDLSKRYNYRPLPVDLSLAVRHKYTKGLPQGFIITGEPSTPLYSPLGTTIATGYTRIVVGDYGAFIEFSKKQAIKDNLKIQSGQEFRTYPKYKDKVKYIWLTARDDSAIKVYYQKRTVTYADYRAEMLYVSPYEVIKEVK